MFQDVSGTNNCLCAVVLLSQHGEDEMPESLRRTAAVATVARYFGLVMMLRQDKRISRLKRSCSEQRFVPECNPLFFNPCRKFKSFNQAAIPLLLFVTISVDESPSTFHNTKLNAQTFLIQARSSFSAVTGYRLPQPEDSPPALRRASSESRNSNNVDHVFVIQPDKGRPIRFRQVFPPRRISSSAFG